MDEEFINLSSFKFFKDWALEIYEEFYDDIWERVPFYVIFLIAVAMAATLLVGLA